MSAAEKIADHQKIRRWAAARGGRPAFVAETAGKGVALEEVSRDRLSEILDDSKLARLEQEETAGGGASRFAKFVSR